MFYLRPRLLQAFAYSHSSRLRYAKPRADLIASFIVSQCQTSFEIAKQLNIALLRAARKGKLFTVARVGEREDAVGFEVGQWYCQLNQIYAVMATTSGTPGGLKPHSLVVSGERFLLS